jgi:RHS repeat-associated protein
MWVSGWTGPSPSSFTPTSSSWFNPSTNRLTGAGAGYDFAGNQTAIGGYSFTYDGEDRLKTSTINSATTTYSYDGEGRRVKKVSPTETRGYVYDAQGQLAAEYGPLAPVGGRQFLTADHLGSTRLVTDATGQRLECHDYLPFGEELTINRDSCYAASASLTLKFTGKERDTESGLDYFGARYFSGAQGRFTSPDTPLLSRLDSPQMWNLYAYTANNPLKRIDPDGQNWFNVNGTWTWYEGSDVDAAGNLCKKGAKGCTHSDYTHLIVFQQTKTNRYGAATGTLTLYGHGSDDKVAQSPAFSGGVPGKGPVPGGTFTIRLDVRDTVDPSDIRQGPAGAELRPFHGIQAIPENVGGYDVRWEWGSIRARLNETRGEKRNDFLGNYLHGKNRPGDYTHGCIAERSEQILRLLLQMDPKLTPAVPVDVRRK